MHIISSVDKTKLKEKQITKKIKRIRALSLHWKISSIYYKAGKTKKSELFASYFKFIQVVKLTFKSDTLAKTKLVSASPKAIRAPHPGSTRALIGCSPIAVAEPTVSKCVSAVTATSATGVCKGPTHCCWATRPVTLRSTLKSKQNVSPTI